MQPTPEQQAAIQTLDRPLVVVAGAGTGKTWVLVERFVHLLRSHPEWPLESIIAITFTEKAAREMRTRIRRRVDALAREGADVGRWQARRQELERLQVSTIHGLCARILRENAIQAVIDPRFVVLDEQEAALLQEAAIEETIRQMEEEGHPALALLDALTVRDLRVQLSELLVQRGTVEQLFATLPGAADLLQCWTQGVADMRQAIWERVRSEFPLQDCVDLVTDTQVIDPQDRLAGTVEAANAGCQALAAGDLLTAAGLWCGLNLSGGKQANWGGKEALAELKEALKMLRAAAQTLESAGALGEIGPSDEQAAAHLQHWKAAWQALSEVYGQRKAARQALDFDDLELLAVHLLESQPRSPRLQAYLDGIHHLLVDEFQDTNGMQQRIVAALSDPLESGKLFVVGDAKQSIYRFRQAQVSLFNTLMARIEARTGASALALSRSFRTHSRLVSGLNALFERILQPAGPAPAPYEAVSGPLQAQRQDQPAGEADIEVLLLPQKDLQDERIKAEDARIWEAQWLAARLAEMKAQAMPVWDKDQRGYRPFGYGDAAVLFRATTSLPLYEQEFKAAGIPYLTVSGRGYYERPEVQDLLALLSALYNPSDDFNIAVALRSALFCLSDDTLYLLRWRDPAGQRPEAPVPLRQALAQAPPTPQPEEVARAAEILRQLWAAAGRVQVWALLRMALDLTGFEAALARNDGENGRQRSNVVRLLELARQAGGASLAGFLRQVHDLKAREAREGEAPGREPSSGAVQLMSIHAAKGLEFPVVFAADLGRSARGGARAGYMLHDPAFGLVCKIRDRLGDLQKPSGYAWGAWLDGEMEFAESKRLLYVACTRAADKLVLSGQPGNRDSWLAAILEAWGIPADGEPDETLALDGYSLQVHRPVEPPPPQRAAPIPSASESLALSEIPPLSQPLSVGEEVPTRSVSDLVEALRDGLSGERALASLQRAARPQERPSVPGYLLGELIHTALAEWDSLAWDDSRQLSRIERIARAHGVHPQALAQAVQTTWQALGRLKRHALYAEIQNASVRLQEVPFQLESPQGVLHGIIDLLYQDAAGDWHLLDWKSEWLAHPGPEMMRTHLPQLAVYARAVHQIMGIQPQAKLCFLCPRVQLVRVSAAQLDQVWQEMAGWRNVPGIDANISAKDIVETIREGRERP